MSSTLKTFVLLAGLSALFVAFGGLIGGKTGMVIALAAALAMNLFAWWQSGEMVLSMYGAREVDARTAPQLYGLVQQLAGRAGLPMPRLFVIESEQPNAFATGRDPAHAAVAVNTGLLNILTQEQVAGVIAHELAHIRNRDTLIMTVTATLAGAISMLANFGLLFGSSNNSEDGRSNPLGPIGSILMVILAPLAAMLVQTAISRTREYQADRVGAEICGQPLWLAGALENLERGAEAIANPFAEAHPATAHLFIVNPLHGRSLATLFSTHPPLAERVRRLRQLVPGGAARARSGSVPPSTGPGVGPGRGPWG